MSIAAALGISCGDDEGGGGGGGAGGGGGSYSSIADSIAKPTGQLAQSNANDVAKEFEKFSSTGAGGTRLEQTQNQMINCPSGGSYSVMATGSQSNARAVLDYDKCCYTAGCCIEGSADWYFAGQGGGAASYNYCGRYDLTYTCASQSSKLQYSGCLGSSGKWVYVVEVGGKTYAVTGSYRSGTGTLEITDSTGKWTCMYTKGSGSCSGTGKTSFSF